LAIFSEIIGIGLIAEKMTGHPHRIGATNLKDAKVISFLKGIF
jgi:hypothetical protein